MMSKYLLGIDSGGTMTKAALFSPLGEELASQSSPVSMLFPKPGYTERNPLEMWQATCKATQAVLHATATPAEDIAAVCATGYGSGLFCVDSHGQPTINGIVSTDTRAVDIVERWRSCGLTAPIESGISQKFWPAQSLVLLAWLQQHRPDVLAATAHILQCKDYIKMRLCGSISIDSTDAAQGGLLDLHTGDYAKALFSTLDLDAWIDKLPPLVSSSDVVGQINAQAAEQTGLKAGTPVVAGAIDVVCSCIGSGVVDQTRMSVVAGTWAIHTAVRKKRPQSDPVPLSQMPFLLPGTYLAMEAGTNSASNLEWNCKHVFDAEYQVAQQAGETIYQRCGQMVESRIDNPSELVFLPYLFGGLSGEKAGFVGLNASHTRADLVYAVFEGIVYTHKRDIDLLMASSGNSPPAGIRLAGGAARSRVWAQMFADVMGMSVEVAEGSEFGARGACICASMGIGWRDGYQQAVDQMVRVRETYEPDPGKHEQHHARYSRFKRVTEALAESWDA